MIAKLRRRLLHTPLFYKILWANIAIVALGAVAGTIITVWHVTAFPDQEHYPLIALFAGAGVVISVLVNQWVLRKALEPLDRLQTAVEAIRSGSRNVRVELGDNSDERFDRLAEAFNQMLEQIEHDSQRLRQLSHQILQAQEEERRRLAHELHDEAAQSLTSLLVHIRLLERAQNPAEAQRHIQELRELTARALEDVRRVALDLRPKILDDLGLAAALEWRVDELNKAHGLQASITIEGMERRLPREMELVFYRIAQEALSNVCRHAQAKKVAVSLHSDGRRCILEVVDDGVGFDASRLDGRKGDGLGLIGMRERIAMIGGSLEIASRPGAGTRIKAQAPWPQTEG
ncbi:HAMP domain-containing sensor histidine kinase [Caldilinea sp.]|uniref:HAMP domain-containing sensor histidine kinase n=1 Tax=Caldilinea sp. TaxID=2293560 RepID=UPI00262713E9|nr:ATP-binding protein [uncultured Caldilinea sp.]